MVAMNQVSEDYRAKIAAAVEAYGRKKGIIPVIYRENMAIRSREFGKRFLKLGESGRWVFAEFMNKGGNEFATGFIYDEPVHRNNEWVCYIIVSRNDLDDVYLKPQVITPIEVLKRGAYNVVYLNERDIANTYIRKEAYQMRAMKNFVLGDYLRHVRLDRVTKFSYELEDGNGISIEAYVPKSDDTYAYIYIESDDESWISFRGNDVYEVFTTKDNLLATYDRAYVSKYSFPHRYKYHIFALRKNVYI